MPKRLERSFREMSAVFGDGESGMGFNLRWWDSKAASNISPESITRSRQWVRPVIKVQVKLVVKLEDGIASTRNTKHATTTLNSADHRVSFITWFMVGAA